MTPSGSQLVTLGTIIAERYRIGRSIGAGGFGQVYEAEHIVTKRRCALKLMMPQAVGKEGIRQRFVQESRLAASIQSEFIVDILDAGVDTASDTPFIAMELLTGEDLGTYLQRRGALPPDECVQYILHAATALDAAHEIGIVHRDLKPSNLFLTCRNNGSALVKVLDFGIAKQIQAAPSAATTQALGTPIYMAPEQFRGEAITAAVDGYALGMLAFRFLVGHHYFEKERRQTANNYALAALLIRGTPEPASARAAHYGASCAKAFDEWFARATHTSPKQRFANGREATEELARIHAIDLDTLTVSASPPSSGGPPLSSTRAAQSAQARSDSGTDGLTRASLDPLTTTNESNLPVDSAGQPRASRARTTTTVSVISTPKILPAADDVLGGELDRPTARSSSARYARIALPALAVAFAAALAFRQPPIALRVPLLPQLPNLAEGSATSPPTEAVSSGASSLTARSQPSISTAPSAAPSSPAPSKTSSLTPPPLRTPPRQRSPARANRPLLPPAASSVAPPTKPPSLWTRE